MKRVNLKQKAEIVKKLLDGKGRFFVGTSTSDSAFQRIVINASDLHIHKHDIEAIEKQADLRMGREGNER